MGYRGGRDGTSICSAVCYDLMLASADGGVWLREFRRPREEGPHRWMIFDPTGQLLGSVAMPGLMGFRSRE